jgi:hypothetical protein
MFGLNALQASPAGAEVDLNASQLHQGDFVKGIAADANGIAAGGTGRWQYTDPNPRRNYVMQWNFNVQRQITTSDSVMVAYAGSRGIHNPFQTDTLNTCFPKSTSAGWLFPGFGTTTDCQAQTPGPSCVAPTGITAFQMVNPCFGNLLLSTVFQSESWYKSLQLNWTRKMSHGLQFEVSYTWQSSVDTSSGSFAGDNFSSVPTAATPWWDLNLVKGPSDFNVGQNLSLNWLYEIPTPKSWTGAAKVLAGGWGYGGIVDISTGTPMWPLIGLGSDPLFQNNGEPMDIPSLAPGCTPKNAVQLTNTANGISYLKPSCFIYPIAPNAAYWNANCVQDPTLLFGAGATFAGLGMDPLTCTNLMGNLKRNSITGPGLINFDMSFIKDTHIPKLGENFNIQFRADIFNIFNRTNLPLPDSQNGAGLVPLDPVQQPLFGIIDSQTQVPMREMQFSLKLVW